MFCETCGLNFAPKQRACAQCGHAPTRHWLQLMGLSTLMVAVSANSLVAWFLLPRLAGGHQARLFFRAWMWLDEKGSLYGWVPLALGILAWDYFVRRGSKPKIRGWVTRKLLAFALLAGVAPAIPWWVPAGQPPQTFLTAIGRHPGLPAILAWGVVVFVVILLCVNAETRDSLLGHGRILSLASLGVLLLLLAMTMVGWGLT
ncbi:MAG: hypothetical protein WBC04_00440 [Candidatus Acidiferrales bacterium]